MIVVVQTRSIVTEIEIDGAQSFSAKTLRNEIKIKINTPVSEDAAGGRPPEHHRFLSSAMVTTTSTSSTTSIDRMKRTALRARFSRSTKARRARSVAFVSRETTLSAIAPCASR